MIIPKEEERGSLRHCVGELTDVLVLWRYGWTSLSRGGGVGVTLIARMSPFV